jgi:hypothetical protein
MKALRVISLMSVGAMLTFFMACEIVTEQPASRVLKPANGVVMNELYILPPPNPFAHHWIELYNPTNARVRLANWTLGFRTKRFFLVTDTTGVIVKGFLQDTVSKYYDVPFQSRTIVKIDTTVLRSTSNLSIPANNFMTIVSDEARMRNYTAWGSEGGVRIDLGGGGFNGQPVIGFERYTFFRADTTQIDSLIQVFYNFVFESSDQLVLKDSTGSTIDVLRYGNYTFSGVGADPYPNNRSLGSIVPYQSFARFGGAYKTGPYSNSAEDFYVTGVQIPIPSRFLSG